jgi:hypothetical protein
VARAATLRAHVRRLLATDPGGELYAKRQGAQPDAATHTEPWATARFPNVEQALAAARLYRGCVTDLMRGGPAGPPGRGQPSRAGGA